MVGGRLGGGGMINAAEIAFGFGSKQQLQWAFLFGGCRITHKEKYIVYKHYYKKKYIPSKPRDRSDYFLHNFFVFISSTIN